MQPSSIRSAILLVMIVTVGLWGQQRSHGVRENDWSELINSMEKMDASMQSIERSGNSDIDFVQLMLPHHQAAIDMAKAQLLYGKDPQIRRLAQEIITDQQSEIELMQLWLKQRQVQK